MVRQKISPVAFVHWATGGTNIVMLCRQVIPIGPTPVARQIIIVYIRIQSVKHSGRIITCGEKFSKIVTVPQLVKRWLKC